MCVIAGRDNQIRYFVINKKVDEALDMLKRSLDRTPASSVLGATGDARIRYLQLPPATVCNKVLHAAARSGSMDTLNQASSLLHALRYQNVDIFPRTVIAIMSGFVGAGDRYKGIGVLNSYLDTIKEDKNCPQNEDRCFQVRREACRALLETEVGCKNRAGAIATIALQMDYKVDCTYNEAFNLLKLYVNNEEWRTARSFLFWIWFNRIYLDEQHGTARCYQEKDWDLDENNKRFSIKVNKCSILSLM